MALWRGAPISLAARDLTTVWEAWEIVWSPDFDAACIEAAIYGPALLDAAGARLAEQAAGIERSAERAALLLLDACLAGAGAQIDGLLDRLMALVRQDSDCFSVGAALGHLLYLYRYDDTLGALGRPDIRELLVEVFQRALWLLEMLGQPQGQDRQLLRGFSTLVQTFEACERALTLDRAELAAVLRRAAGATAQRPLVRGAATGALWTLGEAAVAQVRADLQACATPEQLGDFLTGLFALAREAAQLHPELVATIDGLMMAFDDTAYLQALPAAAAGVLVLYAARKVLYRSDLAGPAAGGRRPAGSRGRRGRGRPRAGGGVAAGRDPGALWYSRGAG